MACRGLINGLASDQSFLGGEEGGNDAPPFSSSLNCMGGLFSSLNLCKTMMVVVVMIRMIASDQSFFGERRASR